MITNQTKIMLVDDEPDVGYYLKRYLSLRRFQVTIADSAEQALQLLEKEPADIVLLDLVMKGMHGLAAARIIKEKYPQTKIFVVTAHAYDAGRVEQEIPIDGLYIKPVGVQDLLNKLTAL
ncbi:MAG TPA: response regulator [Candidatus Omnitrophota bacterium]|nr:response regulator [Candidatus Omnitrophota bacterium]HRZ15768.1 response regulator [Candidatus Omnitrophota bacterium]